MSLDECHIALREAYADLTDEQFHAYPIAGRHNIATVVMHVLQQHDEFCGTLHEHLCRPVTAFVTHERRFRLWGLPVEELPRAGQPFPAVAEVLAGHDALHAALVEGLGAAGEDLLVNTEFERWPRLVDIYFRALWHGQAHVRQIWLLRGVMGLAAKFAEQHYA
ncbi:MAG: DinB family protein [Armatimonadetes bacterium]|nr:DinB family protein [Armatimonadota bacterium]